MRVVQDEPVATKLPALACDQCGGHPTWRLLADDGEEILACGYDVNDLLEMHTLRNAIIQRTDAEGA